MNYAKEIERKRKLSEVTKEEENVKTKQQKVSQAIELDSEKEEQYKYILSQILEVQDEEKASISPVPQIFSASKKKSSPKSPKKFSPFRSKYLKRNISPRSPQKNSPRKSSNATSPKIINSSPQKLKNLASKAIFSTSISEKSPSPIIPLSPQKFSPPPESSQSINYQDSSPPMVIPSKKALEKEIEEDEKKYIAMGELLAKKKEQLLFMNEQESRLSKLFK